MAGLTACTPPAQRICTPGTGAPLLLADLYFGRAIAGRTDLTDAEWTQFLDDTITANLPSGYTTMDAAGGWMNPKTRKTIREATKLLVVAVPDTPDSLAAIDRIRRAYQVRFNQQSVGLTVEHACGAF
jgi:anaerobic glycerol-3-phosphate dehydrogenase